ncbi:hypothetical protein HF521_015606 [Silurus meridionalis]|uniref:Alkylated DNA repair protein AlkB homologue 8 N-terminal domain-containing protein n=1 Tax=Silurus meridionalis TaxID=175797 RepID=A0A8T0A6Z4_SILME|nr:hypothetical protein HF521_015606 [Silurus meridionalis]
MCIPGARAPDIAGQLRFLGKHRFSKIVFHTGANDIRRQSEVTKSNIIEVRKLAKAMSDAVACSGPIPMRRGDVAYSRLWSLNCWMSEWCSKNNVGFINNWSIFEGKAGLLGRDGIHPTREDKTEVLLLGPHAARSKLSDYVASLDGVSVSACTAVKDLGVIIDPSLSFESHVNNIPRIAFFHLRNIAKIRNMMSLQDAEKLVHAFVTSRLDYCNALLSGCASKCINKLQLVQNAAARVLTRSRKYDHIAPVLISLHWLPLKSRIDYKILLLTYKALNTLALQYLSELLYQYDPPRLLRSKAMHSSNHIIKFADDTTVVGLISKNDESAYREDLQRLTAWCGANNLSLNVDKMKEMVVDFRRAQSDQSPLIIDGSSVEIVKSTKFLGVHLADNLTWSLNISSITKKAQQRLYFLRMQRKTHLPPPILTMFYRGTIESILSSCITAWFGNCTVSDRKTLQRIVRTAEKIIGVSLPSIMDIYTRRCIRKAHSIVDDHTHPSHTLFTLLPSGKRFQSIRAATRRLCNSFFPQAIRLLNTQR